MSNNFSVNWIDGTLYIRTRDTKGKPKSKSLGIQVSKNLFISNFDKKIKRFKKNSRYPQFEDYNSTLSYHLTRLEESDSISETINNDRKSFLTYTKLIIKTTTNHGSKMKLEVVVGKLGKFLNSLNKTELLFREITPEFLRNFKSYCLTTKDPKKLSNNTTNHYLKIISGFIQKAAKDETYHYLKNPFLSMEYKNERKNKGVLEMNDIKNLLDTEITDPTIKMARNMFLFQLFSNGMRVSDLLLLRWKNFKEGRLVYTMYKTKYEIDIPFNVSLGKIINDAIGFGYRNININTEFKIPYVDVFGEKGKEQYTKASLKDIDNILKQNIIPIPDEYTKEWEKFMVQLQNGKLKEYKGYIFKDEVLPFMVRLIEHRERFQQKADEEFLHLIKAATNIRRKGLKEGTKPNDFVFPYLNNEMFSDIKGTDFSKITLQQYKHIKHNTIVYNRHLKDLMEICNIDTNITSHVSRHSFTSILIKDSLSTYDIQLALGHSSLRITENYIKKGFKSDRTESIGELVSSKFRI